MNRYNRLLMDMPCSLIHIDESTGVTQLKRDKFDRCLVHFVERSVGNAFVPNWFAPEADWRFQPVYENRRNFRIPMVTRRQGKKQPLVWRSNVNWSSRLKLDRPQSRMEGRNIYPISENNLFSSAAPKKPPSKSDYQTRPSINHPV